MDDEAKMTFGEHLEDLRRRLILALLGIVVGVVVCGIFHKSITREMLRPYQKAWMALHNPPVEQPTPPPTEGQPAEAVPDAGKPAEKVPLTPVQIPGPPAFFVILVKMCLILGIMLASPWVIYQIWQVVAAGLF
ncbi:MAG: twin-arginine translocase subunit TatC, partial [Phycisphaerae bacterium]|nr:twin-arginine translocase subunit TatC [Phycisphaerae bacterium]